MTEIMPFSIHWPSARSSLGLLTLLQLLVGLHSAVAEGTLAEVAQHGSLRSSRSSRAGGALAIQELSNASISQSSNASIEQSSNASIEQSSNATALLASSAGAKVSPRHHVGPSFAAPGHLLTNSELANITSVACLEAKQRDAAIICDDSGDLRLSTNAFRGEISPANYPNYSDPACYGFGDFLCDTKPLLSEEERAHIEAVLTELRGSTSVNCGILTRDPVDPIHKQPFYLGVALLDEWPLSALDPGSLDAFGQQVAAQWNMAERWVGLRRNRAACPNEAMLLIAPKHRQAYISSASCEFICPRRGGPEIVTATLVNLESKGLASGIEAGIRQAYHVLSAVDPQMDILNKESREVEVAKEHTSATVFNVAQQALFVVLLVALAGSVVVGFLVLLMAPGYMRSLGKL